jgi:hypothetical protein
MGYCCAGPAPHLPHPGPSPKVAAFGSDRQRAWPTAANTQGRSALDCVVQVQHAVTLDHPVGIIEEDSSGVAAEKAHPFPQNHRGDLHHDLVDESCRERLPA